MAENNEQGTEPLVTSQPSQVIAPNTTSSPTIVNDVVSPQTSTTNPASPSIDPVITSPVRPENSPVIPVSPVTNQPVTSPSTPGVNDLQNSATPSTTQPLGASRDSSALDPKPTVVSFDSGLPTTKKPKKLKKLIIPGSIIIFLLASAAAFYFGYWMNPNVIWSESLTDTAKGYNKVVSYLSTQSNINYTGDSITASLSVQSAGTTYTGNITEQNDGSNSKTAVNLNLGPNKVNLQALTIKPSGADSPDFYFNISGFKTLGLGALVGINEPQLDSLDGQWISVNHQLIDAIKKAAIPSATNAKKLSKQDVVTTAQSVGVVNSKYVFTVNPKYSVTTVVKKYGFETVDGHKTYHYQVGFVKANVKSYITALRDAVQNTPVGKWAATSTGQSINNLMGYDNLESSADNISSKDTVDVWSDVNNRIIYKVRVSDPTNNPSTNYVDIGLDYKTTNSYPFFVNWQSNQSGNKSTASLILTLNTVSNSITGLLKINDPVSNLNISANVSAQPTNKTLVVTAPTSSITLEQALGKLGLSTYYNQLLQSLSQTNTTTPGTYPSNASASSLGSVLQSL